MSQNATLLFEVGGQQVDFPLEAFDITVKSSFLNGNVQADVDIEDLTVFKQYTTIIDNHITNGFYYKGLPIKIKASSDLGVVSVFDGYINLPKLHEILNDGTYRVGVIKKDGLNNLQERLESITWTMLEQQGDITNADYTNLEYVVEKTNNALEIVMLIVVIYVMTKELIEQIKESVDLVNKTLTGAIPSVGFGAVVNVGAILFAVLSILLQVLYIALMLVAIVDMGKRLFELLIQPKRTHKTLQYKRGLEIIANRLGLTLYTNIVELDNYYYLPSNIEVDDINLGLGTISNPKGVSKGYPKANDYGFTAFEFVELIRTQFEADIIINNGQLVIIPKKDPYWKQNSTYVLPDVEIGAKRYNADELVFSRLIKYETDPIADEYTLSNFLGTNYQILTRDNSVTMGADDNFINKHETISFNVALGTRKDKLNAVEKVLKTTGKIIDELTGIFGGGTNLESKVKNRIGVLKVGTNNHTKAKCIYIGSDGKIPTNHRDLTSAKYLYNKYINYKSFVVDNFARQKAVYLVENVPFGMASFLATQSNGWAKDINGNDIKIIDNKWNVLSDNALVEWEKQEIFAPNLYEEFIEQN